jgi:hypothetical protein
MNRRLPLLLGELLLYLSFSHSLYLRKFSFFRRRLIIVIILVKILRKTNIKIIKGT